MQPSRLVLVADVGGERTYHVGDEAMLAANLASLRRLLPALKATVISPQPWPPTDGADNLPGLGFPPVGEASESERTLLLQQFLSAAQTAAANGCSAGADPLARLVCALGRSDALVVSGGGNLHSHWPEHLYERVALSRLAASLGKPVAFLGQTLGPELSAGERELLAPELRQARWVGVRDLPSASLALSLGVSPERLDYQLDDAFLLDPLPPSAEQARLLPSPDGAWIAVTLHPFAAADGEDARRLADQLAAVASHTGARLVFLPHQASKHAASDEAFGRALAAMLPASVRSAVCPVLPARVVRWLTGRAALVISSRYHPLVFGLSAAVPCLAIYSDEYTRVKLRGAMMHAEQDAHWCLSRYEAGRGALAALACDLWARRAELGAELASLQPRWRQQEARRWERVLAAIGLDAAASSSGPPAAAGALLGGDPRALVLELATALGDRAAAARAEEDRLAAELDRLRTELEWVTGTAAWRVRARLLRLRPLLAVYRAMRRRRRGPAGVVAPRSPAAAARG